MSNECLDKTITKRVQVIALFMMIFHHGFGFPDWLMDGVSYIGIPFKDGTVEQFIGQMCKICVSFFSIISGYAFARKNLTWKYVVNKIISMIIVYWITLSIYVIVGLACGNKCDIRNIIYNYLGIRYTINHASWYIAFYILALLTVIPWKKICSEKSIWVIVGLFWIICLVLDKTDINTGYTIEMYMQYMPVVMIGMTMGKDNSLFHRLYGWLRMHRLGVVISIALLVMVMGLRVFTGPYVASFRMVWIYTPLVFTALCVCVEVLSKCVIICKCMDHISTYSTEFWLMHAIFTAQIFFVQRLAYFPRVSVIVFVWQVLILCVICPPIKMLGAFINKRIYIK